MARPPVPCGTYPAYRRHLRKREPVDAACQRAQREHDAAQSVAADRDTHEPVDLPARPSSPQDLVERARASVAAKVAELAAAVTGDDQVDFIDQFDELDGLLEEWIDAEGEVEKARGYPWSPPEIRAQLLATDPS